MTEHFIPPHGGYEQLLSYQKTKVVYDGTVRFCERFLQKRERMTSARLAERSQKLKRRPTNV